MSKKKKILIIFIVFLIAIFIVGATYSFFVSDANLKSENINIAKFIFNGEVSDEIELPLIGLKPGDYKEYNFLVTNSSEENISDIDIEYELTIKTYYFIPFVIKLYKIEEEEILLLTCDGSYSRNSNNEIVCNNEVTELKNNTIEEHNYKLKVEFPSDYDSEKYSNLVDFIDIEIKSWQKL